MTCRHGHQPDRCETCQVLAEAAAAEQQRQQATRHAIRILTGRPA